MINSLVKQRLEQLSPEHKEFLMSDFVNVTAEVFSDSFDFDEVTADVFHNGITMYLLCFLNQEELTLYLSEECGLEPEISATVVQSIAQQLPPTVAEQIETAYQKLNTADEETETNITKPSVDLEEEIAETEQALQAATDNQEDKEPEKETKPTAPTIAAVRTMQDDAQIAQGGQPEERVVQATGQDDLLRRTPTQRQPVTAPDSPAEQPQQQTTPETSDVTSEEQAPALKTTSAAGEETPQPSTEEAAAATPETPTDDQPTTETEPATDAHSRAAAQHKPIDDIVIPTKDRTTHEEEAATAPRPQDSAPPQHEPPAQPKAEKGKPPHSPRWESEQT